MFTGIIQHRARVAETVENDFGRRLVVDASGWTHRPEHGESICVSGVCLTCISREGELAFDVIAQTLRMSTLGRLGVGDAVNLEPCVTAESLMSGHIVQGHVDGVGEVTKRDESTEEVRITIRPPADLMPYMVPKGSVSVDGCSMTLADIHEDSLTLALIPTTLELTTLGLVQPGDGVNIEADILVKTLAHLLKSMDMPSLLNLGEDRPTT